MLDQGAWMALEPLLDTRDSACGETLQIAHERHVGAPRVRL